MLFWISFALFYNLIICYNELLVDWRTKKLIVALSFLIMTIVISFRNNIGMDYNSYLALISLVETNDEIVVEPFFKYTVYIKEWLEASDSFVFFIHACFTSLFLYKGISFYAEKNKCLSLVIYIFYPYLYWYSFSGIRQLLAVSIMFWATRFIVERKKKIFILICVLASAVHFSSIICLIMLALYNFRIKKYHYIVGLNLILISNIFPSSLSNALTGFIMFINPDMGGFLRYANEPLGFSVGLFAEFLMGGLLVFFYKYNNNEKVNFAYNVFVVGMFIRLFFTFGMSYMRLSFYFIVFMIIVIPEVIKKINRPANHYVAILVTFLMSIYFLYSVYMVGIGNSSEPNIQYDINFNILNENVF